MKLRVKHVLVTGIVLLISGCTGERHQGEIYLTDVDTLGVLHTITLPPQLAEVSGIAAVDTLLLAINDSGNSNTVFLLDPESGNILSQIITSGILNNDWEEITYSPFSENLYIGDFGNNAGRRRDLSVIIYDYNRDSLDSLINPVVVSFSYSDQVNYAPGYLMHPWDCEAMVVRDSTISLFSKNWKTQVVYQYNLPAVAGEYTLDPVDSLNLGILVTGAVLDTNEKRLIFCGYFANETYLVVLKNYSGRSYLDGRYKMYRLPSLSNRQVESVSIYNGDIILATEATFEPQALFIVKLPGDNFRD